mgnify:CR=1 FL=1
MMKTKKMLCAVVMVMMLAIMFTVPAFAAGTGDVLVPLKALGRTHPPRSKRLSIMWSFP